MPGYHRLRLPEAYQALVHLGPRGFAWEWLRRNRAFQALWVEAGVAAHRATSRAEVAARRTLPPAIDIPIHPLATRLAPWGLTFLGGTRSVGA